jgi:peptidoglycan/xylan/chitin deacetylase (PgdA/CDA1 family)
MDRIMTLAQQPVTVLTYHRIIADSAIEQFYDVPLSSFEQHVITVAERCQGISDGLIYLENGRHVCFTFDDGTFDHYRASEILAAHGLPGTFFIVAGWLNSEGYLSTSQLADMARKGHRIGSHSVNHPNLTTLMRQELVDELSESKRCLESHSGQIVDWFAAPRGIYSIRTITTARSLGYKVFRTMEWGYNKLPLEGRVSCLPVFRSYDSQMFDRLLDGNAPMWRYSAKRYVKYLVPLEFYKWVRGVSTGLG